MKNNIENLIAQILKFAGIHGLPKDGKVWGRGGYGRKALRTIGLSPISISIKAQL